MSDWGRGEISGQFETLSTLSYSYGDAARVDWIAPLPLEDHYSWREPELLASPAQHMEETGERVVDEYDRAEEVLRGEALDEDEAEEAADRLVRYGMFLCRERVEPVIVELIRGAPDVCARSKLVDRLADYGVELSEALISAITVHLRSDHLWEFLGAVFTLLRHAKSGASSLVESWAATKTLEGERLEAARGALLDLIERGAVS